jgi:hypothetical protein
MLIGYWKRDLSSRFEWHLCRESRHDGVGAGTQDDVGFVLASDISDFKFQVIKSPHWAG